MLGRGKMGLKWPDKILDGNLLFKLIYFQGPDKFHDLLLTLRNLHSG